MPSRARFTRDITAEKKGVSSILIVVLVGESMPQSNVIEAVLEFCSPLCSSWDDS